MNITPFAKGLSQIGRHVLGRKQQMAEAQNRLQLEELKNQMWNRKLQEQARQTEMQRQLMLQKYQADKAAEVQKAEIAAELKKSTDATSLERYNALMAKQMENIGVQKKRLDIEKTRAGKDGKPAPDKTLQELERMRKLYQGDAYSSPNEDMLTKIDSRIQEYMAAKYNIPTDLQSSKSTYPGMLKQINPWMEQPSLEMQQSTKKDSWKDYIK